MPVEVIMPKVDMDMASGRLAVWHVEEGAAVAKGAALFDIETDKAAMEVESPATGRLHHVLARPGQSVAVGAPVAWIYADGEAVGERPGAPSRPDPAQDPAPASQGAALASVARAPSREDVRADRQPAYGSPGEPAARPAALSVGAPPPSTSAPRATPAARRIAREGGLALAEIDGTGPRGRIQGADAARALARRAAPPAAPLALRRPDPDPTSEPAPDPETIPDAPPPGWTAQVGELHVSRRKGAGTPLLLIHGFAADSTGWSPLERELPRDLPLIRLDLPSHGRSPRRPAAGFQDLLRAAARALDALDAGPVHLLGHSLGGAVALGLADIRPRDVASLTLIAPAGLGPEVDAAALLGIARASRAESLAPWLGRLAATPDGISWDFARAAMLQRLDPDLRAAQLDLAQALFPDGVQAFDLRAALARVTAPTAVVWGREDRILPWRHALAARGEMALHLLEGVGHIPHVECPARLAALVVRHLGRRAWP